MSNILKIGILDVVSFRNATFLPLNNLAQTEYIVLQVQHTILPDTHKSDSGVCYLLQGNMVCGVNKNSLILRLGEDDAKQVLSLSGVCPFDMTGRPMKGWVMVDAIGYEPDEVLAEWLLRAKQFAETLPSK